MHDRSSTALLVALLASLVGCASGPSFEHGVFDKNSVRYRIGPLAPGFTRIAVEGNDLAFYHPSYGTIGVNATCKQYDDVPTEALLNHLLFGTTARSFLVDETSTIDGRGARHAIVDAELDGVPVRMNIYVLPKDGCVYDLTNVTSRDEFARAQPLFSKFVHSFAVLETRSPR